MDMKKLLLWLFAVVVVVFVASCQRKQDDSLLSCFGYNETLLLPSDSLDLEPRGILLPSHVCVYDSLFIVKKTGADNLVDIIDVKNDTTIHLLNIGRGPGEVLSGNICLYGDSLFVYDPGNKVYCGIDIPETMEKGSQTVRQIRRYDNCPKLVIVNSIYRCNDIEIALGWFEEDKWFGVVDSLGAVISGVPYIDFESLQGATRMTKGNFHQSSIITIRPDGGMMACALCLTAAMSICELENGEINEVKRLVYKEPKIEDTGDMKRGGIVLKLNEENEVGCYGLVSDNEHIYMLYSGKPLGGDSPSYECNYLLEFDWDGMPQRKYVLSESITGLYFYNREFYGVSCIPSPRILKYKLPLD